jgi:hypothetical protein
MMSVDRIIHDDKTVYDQSRIDFFTSKLVEASKQQNHSLMSMYSSEINICEAVMRLQDKAPKNYLSIKERKDTSILLMNQLDSKKRFFCNIRDDGIYNEEESDRFKIASLEFLSAINEKEANDAYWNFRDIAEVSLVSKKRILEICEAAPSDKLADYWNDESKKMRKLYLPE